MAQCILCTQRERNMGMLILTKGTRRLIKFFNNQFGPGGYSARNVNLNWMRNNAGLVNDLSLAPSAGTGGPVPNPLTLSPYFLYDLSEKYKPGDPAGKPLFYPRDDANHANLVTRWKYFLQNELQTSCHEAIRQAILL